MLRVAGMFSLKKIRVLKAGRLPEYWVHGIMESDLPVALSRCILQMVLDRARVTI